jgi:hypothetical protein
MAPGYFSLTNVLLATSVLFALGNAVPVPKSLNAGGDKTLILPNRNVWNNLVSIRPRFSSLDNLTPSREAKTPLRPRSQAPSRMVPRSEVWVEATFDPRGPVKRATLSKRLSTSDEIKASTIARAITDLKEPSLPRNPWNRDPTVPAPDQRLTHLRIGTTVVGRRDDDPILVEENNLEKSKRLDIEKEAAFDPKQDVASRDISIENSPVGPTGRYSGSLWRRI